MALAIAPCLPARALVDGDSPSDTGSNRRMASQTLDLVNNDRARNGSPPLQESPALSHVAQVYAEYLLRTGFFGHVDPFGRTPQQRAAYMGVTAPVSENLAWESSSYEQPDALLRRAESGMMNEPPNQPNHRYNILNPESAYVGIGVAHAGEKVVIVQEFSPVAPR
jgi:uncharacterized protein YkwD